MRKAWLWMGLTLSLLACGGLSAPMVAVKGTAIPFPTRTATPTTSSTPSPSATPEPTETPIGSPSATATPMLSLMPTVPLPSPFPAPTQQSRLDCSLIWQSPGNGATYAHGEYFTVGWKVTNTGTAAWDPATVEFTYLGGARLYDYPTVYLEASVAPGQAVVLSVRMRALKKAGRYTTYWSLRQGDAFFCRLGLSIFAN
jgi:hypothetical protein